MQKHTGPFARVPYIIIIIISSLGRLRTVAPTAYDHDRWQGPIRGECLRASHLQFVAPMTVSDDPGVSSIRVGDVFPSFARLPLLQPHELEWQCQAALRARRERRRRWMMSLISARRVRDTISEFRTWWNHRTCSICR